LKSEYNIHIENKKRIKFTNSEEALTGGADWIERVSRLTRRRLNLGEGIIPHKW